MTLAQLQPSAKKFKMSLKQILALNFRFLNNKISVGS